MYKIDENSDKARYILLIPAMLDDHFPLLKYAFYSKDYRPIILDNENGIKDIGLKYVNNDMCYPAILNVGQMIQALQSGKYDLNRTALLMPQAGDACRGSNYISILRKALASAGYNVPVLSLNTKGLDKDSSVHLRADMVWRALISVVYCDLIMILCNQIRPYECEKGITDKVRDKWISILGEKIRKGKKIGLLTLKKQINEIACDFKNISKKDIQLKKVGIVGELYVKYCHIGNWNLIKCLENEKCECYVNGLLWYILYYIDTHFESEGFVLRGAYKAGSTFILKIQKVLVDAVRSNGFYIMDPFDKFKSSASDYVNFCCSVGDGWLIGAEVVAFSEGEYNCVIAAQPFGCMANQVCGRSLYTSLSRRIGNVSIASVDYDPGASKLNILNRIKMILENYK